MQQGKTLGRLLLEVFSIVLGVLLALGVSEWQEQRRESELAAKALINVHKELQANLTILQQIHDNNRATYDAIDLDAEPGADADTPSNRQFIPGVQLRDAAWQAMLASGVANYVDYEQLLELGELYSIQSVYRDTGRQLVEASMDMAALAAVNGLEIDNRNLQRQFYSLFSMMLQMEEALLQSYAEMQAILENTGVTAG